MRSVRRKPRGLPVATIMPSRAANVSGAQLTLTQPDRSLPLNNVIGGSAAVTDDATMNTASVRRSTVHLRLDASEKRGSERSCEASLIKFSHTTFVFPGT